MRAYDRSIGSIRCGSLHFFFVHLFFIFNTSILILLILRNEIVHVGFSLSELHFVHTFTSVPMEECFSSEHLGELFADSLEHLLDGSGVTKEGNSHLETLRGNIANGGFDVVGDPLNEVRRVLVLDVQHLLVNFLSGHTTTEEGRGSEISSVSGIGSAHHVFGVEHLLGELGDGKSAILLGAAGGKGSETSHEEMETGERDQVDSELSQVRVELTWETETAGDTGEGGRDEMVKITISWGGELKGSEADIIKSFVINAHNLIGVFDELMD